MQHVLRAAPQWLILAGLIAALLAATEIGRAVARRQPIKDKDSGSLATGMLGILALLIAFTYSLSLQRYDARRAQVLQEANAIGSTANYAMMLPPARRDAVLPLLRRYTEVRIDLGSPYEAEVFARQVAASNGIMAQLWREATALTAEAPQSLPAYRFVAALSEQSNIAEARLTALRNHVPSIVLVTLAGIAMVSLGFAGWSSALNGFDRYVGLAVVALSIAALIALTIDLDRPNRGSITISKQPLLDTLAGIPAP